MVNRWKKTASYLLDSIIIFVGTAIYAFGVYAFTVPNQIAPGGVTGIATVINAFTGFHIGIMVSIFNIPLLILGYRVLGRRFIANTLLSTVFFNIQYDYIFSFLPQYRGNEILAAIFGGLFIGLGLAVVYMRGGSTGGTDIINRILSNKFQHFSLGNISFATDLLIVTVAAICFRSIEAALYAIIAMFVTSKTIDALIYGANVGKMVLIVSDQCSLISEMIIKDMSRGCTLMDARGAYEKKYRQVLLCACKDAEFYTLKRIVKQIDSKAFMIVTDAGDVFGEGFSRIDR